MASRHPSLLARAFEPFASGLWILFVIWTALVAVVWSSGFGEAELRERVSNPGLLGALEFFLASLDAAWIALGAANIHLALSAEEGLPTARRWALIVLAGAGIAAALSERSAFPLGPIHYTSRLGMRIGPVPFGLPLLWFALVTGARALALRCAPRTSHARAAFATGMLAALADVSLEPIAWKARAFWIWYPATTPAPAWPPVQNSIAWLAISWAFAFAMRETRVAAASGGSFPRPALVFLIFNAVFLLTHAARFFQR